MLKIDKNSLRDDATDISNNLADIFTIVKDISDSDMFLTGDNYWKSPACDHIEGYYNYLVKASLDMYDIYNNVTEFLDNVCNNVEEFESNDYFE